MSSEIVPIIRGDAQRLPLADEVAQLIVTSPAYFGLRRYGHCDTTFSAPEPEWGPELPGAVVGLPCGTESEHEWQAHGPSHDTPMKMGRRRDRAVVPRKRAIGDASSTCAVCGAWRGEAGQEPSPAAYIGHLVTMFREVRRVLRRDGACFIVIGDTWASRWPCLRPNVRGQGSLADGTREARPPRIGAGLKDKDLMGIPFALAFALREDGWHFRQVLVWEKLDANPEGALRDRFRNTHEYILLLTKRGKGYWFDERMRAWGSVWRFTTAKYNGDHDAVFPTKLARRLILAGSRPGDVVLDPFCGSGTTVEVAWSLRRFGIGVDLVEGYCRDHAVKRFRRGQAQGRQTVMELR